LEDNSVWNWYERAAINEECILTADLDAGEISEGKFDLDVAGRYARPDVFWLVVNEGSG
jgi:nitrilase